MFPEMPHAANLLAWQNAHEPAIFRVRARNCQALFRKLSILWQVIPPLSGDAMHNANLTQKVFQRQNQAPILFLRIANTDSPFAQSLYSPGVAIFEHGAQPPVTHEPSHISFRECSLSYSKRSRPPVDSNAESIGYTKTEAWHVAHAESQKVERKKCYQVSPATRTGYRSNSPERVRE
jgi:hypothetical protein